MGLMTEKVALEVSVTELGRIIAECNAILADLYDSAPAYAGEVEAVKEAAQTAIKVLRGEPVE
jgi:hypothetical protein